MNNSLNSIFLSLNLQCVTVIFLCVQSLKPKVCPTAQSHECKKQNRNICGADDHFEFSYLMSKGPFALFLSACLTPMLHCSHISFLESCQPEFPSINHSVGRLVEAANSLFRTANGDGWECGWMRRGEVKRRASEAFTLTCFSNWSNTEAVWNWGWWKNQFSIYSWHQAFILKCKQGDSRNVSFTDRCGKQPHKGRSSGSMMANETLNSAADSFLKLIFRINLNNKEDDGVRERAEVESKETKGLMVEMCRRERRTSRDQFRKKSDEWEEDGGIKERQIGGWKV